MQGHLKRLILMHKDKSNNEIIDSSYELIATKLGK